MLLRKFVNIKKKIISLFTENFSTKIMAFFITLVLWLIVVGSKNVEMTKDIPVRYKTSNELMVSNNVPEKIQVSFLGPRSLLRDLIKNKFTIDIDLRDKRVGLVSYRLKNEIYKNLKVQFDHSQKYLRN